MTSGSGTIVAANISNVGVTCQTLTLGLTLWSIDFATQIIQTGAIEEITLTSSGTGPITLSAIGALAAPFSLAGGSCTALPITLAPGQSCALRVQFLPTAAGVFNDQLTIISTASASPTLVLLRGVGVIPLPVSTLSPLGLLLLVFSMGLLGRVALRPQAI